MLGPFDPKRHTPLNDLDTLRDALAGIHANLKRVPGMELAAELIETALAEIALVERRRLTSLPRNLLDPRGYGRKN